jgi:hypothetical protein
MRHSHPIALLSLSALLVTLAPAPADSDADARARVRATPSAAAQPVATVYEFENDNVDGETLKPDGVPVPGSHRARFASLIQVRGAFTDHMIRLALDI